MQRGNKVITCRGTKKVTTRVTAAGDTNFSDATAYFSALSIKTELHQI